MHRQTNELTKNYYNNYKKQHTKKYTSEIFILGNKKKFNKKTPGKKKRKKLLQRYILGG